MKPSRRQAKACAARLYAGPIGGLLLVVIMAIVATMATMTQRAAATAATAAPSKAPAGQAERLALGSRPRQMRAVAALSETELAEHETSTSERKLSLGAPHRDLSVGQSIANAKVEVSGRDLAQAAAGHYGKGHGHGKYYMYAESPKKGAYKAGFKRGNHKHMIMRKEAQHKSHAHGYMKWHDKKGKGSHKWEYKHHKGKHGHY